MNRPLENAKGRKHESLLTFKMASLECVQTDLSPQVKQTVTLLITEEEVVARSILVLDIIRTVSRKKLSESAGTFQICFSYFLSFNMKSFSLKIFKMNQTEFAPNMTVFLHNVPSIPNNMTLILKRPQRRNTHSSHKHDRCTPDIYCNLLKAEQNLFF